MESRQKQDMSETEAWYIVKQSNGQCSLVSSRDIETQPAAVLQAEPVQTIGESSLERWGPYSSQQEAIARRVGLIRAGKCQPA